MKEIYILQPYEVGSKNSKSLAFVIPSKLRKEYGIDISTVLALRADRETRRLTIQTIKGIFKETNKTMPTGESLVTSDQKASRAQ